MGAFEVRKASDNANNGFNETIEYKVLNQANVGNNHLKFYSIELQKNNKGEYRLFTHYGRLGSSNIYEIRDKCEGRPITNFDAVKKEFDSIFKKKLRGKRNSETGEMEAYVEVDVVSSSVGSENICNKGTAIKTVTVKKASIDTSSYDPKVGQLLDQLISENIHAITHSSKITYSSDSGFSTPLGSVTPQFVDKARVYLDQINSFMDKDGKLDPEKEEVKKVHNIYYSMIPHEFGRKITIEDMITDTNKLQVEYDLLDNLSTAVKIGVAMSGSTSQRMNALGTDIELLNDFDEISRLKKYICESKAYNHRHEDVWNYDVKTIYKIRIPEERNRFEMYGRKLGNIKELMHGSSNCNLLSLLYTGMKQTSVNAPGVTGKMFGELGLYFSDMSTKSLRYSLGYWGAKKSKNNNAFLFIADVALGKTFEMRSGSYSYKGAKPGYDSTSAYAHSGFLYNNEYIIYSTIQNTFTYLVEFTPGSK